MEERLKQDDIQFLDEASELVKQEYGESYTRSGVFRLFKPMKVKKKTGRPVNIRQDEEDLVDF
ncbi:MAG: winged helix-turn-helix domain-containing protein [Bacteroidota bacterium]